MDSERQQLRHLLVVEDQLGRRTVSLEATTASIGRDSTNSIVLHSQLVSRQHAILLRITVPGTTTYLFRLINGDLQGKPSTNGLTVNGQPISSYDLKHGDVIAFGGEVKAKYYAISNLSDVEFLESCEVEDISGFLSELSQPYGKLTSSNGKLKHRNEAALVRLASFPELNPNPTLEIDLAGKILYLNPAAIRQFPLLSKQGQHHPILADLVSTVQATQEKFSVREVAVGSETFEQSVHFIAESDLIRSFLVNITRRKRIEAALRESEERYALAAAGANDGLWDWNLRTNQVFFSPRWKSMLGCTDEGKDNLKIWFSRIHAEELARVKGEIAAHLKGRTPHFESVHRLLHQDGTYRWMLSRALAVRDSEGKAYRIAGSQTDITSLKEAEAQLLHDALHDHLTGLPNRTLFMDRLGQSIERAKRLCQPGETDLFAVLFLDLDRFKVVNDSLGHLAGDQLLIAIALRLTACLRPGDTVARLGGDEFAILLEEIKDISDATSTAERIQQELTLPFQLNGHEIFTTMSIGIALSTGISLEKNLQPTVSYDRPEDLLRDADISMYRAKAQGKARHEVFNQALHDRVVTLLQLENDLRRAIERQELRVHYQPIVCLSTGKITGFEALVRWQHPERGLISSGEFVAVAEETGLIIPIGSWVLCEACYQMSTWQKMYQAGVIPVNSSQAHSLSIPKNSPHQPLTISVNLSSKQFSQPDIAEQVKQVLQESGLNPHSLKLEITESVLMEHAESLMDILFQLRALSVQLQVDDFGTGYSSLSYLHRFPIDSLKIDRSFISGIGTGGTHTLPTSNTETVLSSFETSSDTPSSGGITPSVQPCIAIGSGAASIIGTIATLAHNLGMSVIAEGIETPEQLSQLRALGCEYGQGYLFSKPVDAKAIEALIATQPQW